MTINNLTTTEAVLTKEELNVLYHCGYEKGTYAPGGFMAKLIDAMMYADFENLTKLGMTYPELAKAVRSYKCGDLYDRYLKGQTK